MALHQKHSKISTFHDTLSLGYPSRYTKSTQNLNFSRYPLTWVSISLHQKHSKISTFQDTLSLGYLSRYTKSTQKSQLFTVPSHLGIHLVTPKALKNLNFSGYPLTWIFDTRTSDIMTPLFFENRSQEKVQIQINNEICRPNESELTTFTFSQFHFNEIIRCVLIFYNN